MKTIIIAEPVLDAVGRSNTFLQRGGFTLHPVRSSEKILLLHRESAADLIITDNDLPVMGGERLCAAIRHEPTLRAVSIILLCDGAEAAERCRRAGANAVLEKPLMSAQLFARVAELLLVAQRKEMRIPLRVKVAGQGCISGVSQNVSISGMLLECERALQPGDSLTCEFSIGGREVTAGCVVQRAQRIADGRYQFGVLFQNLDTKYLVLIDQYVKNRVKE